MVRFLWNYEAPNPLGRQRWADLWAHVHSFIHVSVKQHNFDTGDFCRRD